jgi:hypothetical protein
LARFAVRIRWRSNLDPPEEQIRERPRVTAVSGGPESEVLVYTQRYPRPPDFRSRGGELPVNLELHIAMEVDLATMGAAKSLNLR